MRALRVLALAFVFSTTGGVTSAYPSADSVASFPREGLLVFQLFRVPRCRHGCSSLHDQAGPLAAAPASPQSAG